MGKARKILILLTLTSALLLSGCMPAEQGDPGGGSRISTGTATVVSQESIQSVPYSGAPYIEVNGNIPSFPEGDYTTTSFESYSDLDELGRCGVAYANIGQDLMPTEHRGDISKVRPTGWHSVQYDFVECKNLYNRCHLIGFQLTAENANKCNLITGTRYLNVEGMLPFENMVTDYIKETNHHVLYRVTPFFEGDNLVASGVQMEARSVEDDGEGIEYNVYCYNVQPGVEIDYATGESWLVSGEGKESQSAKSTYILNTSRRKFHRPDCAGVKKMSAENKQKWKGSREELVAQGYEPCGQCKP